jgi:hypothetical protein
VRHGSDPEIRRLNPNAAQGRYRMFESMSVALGIIFGLAGFALAVLLGLTLYKDKTGEVHHTKPVVDAPEHETA